MSFLFFRRRSNVSATPVQVQEQRIGRRYRNDVPYALPKDLEEGNRLNLQHYLFRYALQGNFVAPLKEQAVQQILDIGSGTGIWGQEIAQQFPQARIYGLDLEPPQVVSLSANVQEPPDNYHFLQGNVLKGVPFPDLTFDFVHQRMLCAAIPDEQWPFVLQELWRVTKVGGWIELLEVYSLANPGPSTALAFEAIERYLLLRGIRQDKFEHFEALCRRAGIINMRQQHFTIPISWKGHVGTLMERDVLSSFQALKPKVCEALHLPLHEFDHWLNQIPAECKRHRSCFQFSLLVAQKFFANGVQ